VGCPTIAERIAVPLVTIAKRVFQRHRGIDFLEVIKLLMCFVLKSTKSKYCVLRTYCVESCAPPVGGGGCPVNGRQCRRALPVLVGSRKP
jgi:hypothetical protein